MTLTPQLSRLLDRLPVGAELEFSALLDAIESVRYSGPITFDFLNGRPKQISLGQPIKLVICAGVPTRGLDKGAGPEGG